MYACVCKNYENTVARLPLIIVVIVITVTATVVKVVVVIINGGRSMTD